MSTKEIQLLRKKFIIIAMFSFFLVMLFIGAVINTISFTVTTVSIRSTLTSISRNDGRSEEDSDKVGEKRPSLPTVVDAFSPTYRHNHFFVLSYNEDGTLAKYNSNTDNTSENNLVQYYAKSLLQFSKDFGRYGTYYYLRGMSESGLIQLTILDCSAELSSFLRLLSATIATCLLALLITFGLVLALSERVIQPEIENSMRQKQFITNASHELKTPLAVIRANTELSEMMHGEDEWTKSTLKQVDHLNGLIQNLVLIAKAAEREDKSVMAQIDASKCVEESAANFEAMAKQSEITLQKEIEPNVHLIADESKVRQLATLLIDNAIKYCDEKGTVCVFLTPLKKGKNGLRLTVSNSYSAGAGIDCNRFFDRFYRQDQSHNIDKGGYGIGLSIAESICKQNGGSIKALWKDGVISFICQLT